MAYKERGRITQKVKEESGVSKAGKEWVKQDFWIETEDPKFAKKLCFTLFGDKKELIAGLNIGDLVDVSFSVESRDFNGKAFHNVNGFAVDAVVSEGGTASAPPSQPDSKEDENDLPF